MTTLSRSRSAMTAAPRRPKNRGGAIGYYLLMTVLAVAFLFPLVWTLLSSVKTKAEAAQSPPTYLPHAISLDNYRGLLIYGVGLWGYLGNSLTVSALTVAITLFASVLGGYGFARYTFPGKNALFFVTLAILMVPYPTILIALYYLLARVGLQNSLVGLSFVLVVFQLPFSTYLMRNSIESFPRELEEAAVIDGCSTLQALRRIVLPSITPGIITVALFSFLASWNEFLAPLIFLNDSSKFTLPVMLVNVRSGAFGTVDYGALQSGVVVAMLPCVILFVALQRFYISGLVAGSLK